MTHPTRQEIIEAQLARQWAEWNKSCEVSSPEIQAAANFILANTPTPSMAEVEWDDDKHYLAEAEHLQFGKVIMLYKNPAADSIEVIYKNQDGITPSITYPGALTPTGRRYTLTEVQE